MMFRGEASALQRLFEQPCRKALFLFNQVTFVLPRLSLFTTVMQTQGLRLLIAKAPTRSLLSLTTVGSNRAPDTRLSYINLCAVPCPSRSVLRRRSAAPHSSSCPRCPGAEEGTQHSTCGQAGAGGADAVHGTRVFSGRSL